MSADEDATRKVAIAMFITSGDGQDTAAEFDALAEGDQADMLELARVAMVAHLQWLKDNDFRVLPPGAVLVPKSMDEAKAMTLALREFTKAQKRKESSLVRPGLILGTQH